MTLSDGVRESARGHFRASLGGRRREEKFVAPTAVQPRRRRRGGSCAIGLICGLAGGVLAGCGLSDGPVSLLLDSGRYSAYHCNDLVTQLQNLRKREKDLRALMDKANESGSGVVIGALSYRSEYATVLGQEKIVQRTAAEKNCALVPTYQSDRTIR